MPSDSSAADAIYDIPQNSIKSEPDQCFVSGQEIQGVPQDQFVAHNPAHANDYSQVPHDSFITEQVTCTSQAQSLNTWQSTQQGDPQYDIQGVPQYQSVVSIPFPVRLLPCNISAGQVTGDMYNNDTEDSGSGDKERSHPGEIQNKKLRTGQRPSVRKMLSCFHCKYCDQYLHDKQHFTMHISRHEKKYRKFWMKSGNLVQNTTPEIMWIPTTQIDQKTINSKRKYRRRVFQGYKCEHCSQRHQTYIQARLHEQWHLNYPCCYCGLGFSDRNEIKEHMKSYHGSRNNCMCYYEWKNPKQLQITTSKLLVSGILGNKCRSCGSDFGFEDDEVRHRACVRPLYICCFCHQVMEDYTSLVEHKKAWHSKLRVLQSQ